MTTGRINQVNGAPHESCREASNTGSDDVKHLSSDILQMKNMKLQIRSIFDSEPTTSVCRTHFTTKNALQCDPFISGTSNLRTQLHGKRMALETRTPNNTHPRSRRTAPARKRPQFIQAGRDAKTPRREIAEKKKQPSSLLSPHIPSHTLTEQTDFAGHQEEPCEEVPRNVVRNLSNRGSMNSWASGSNFHVMRKNECFELAS